MKITSRKLIGLNVQTKSGKNLGRIFGFEVDTDTHQIEKYYVKTRGLIPGLFENKLIISWRQVVSISKEAIIVEDSAVRDSDADAVKKSRLITAGSGGGVIEANDENR